MIEYPLLSPIDRFVPPGSGGPSEKKRCVILLCCCSPVLGDEARQKKNSRCITISIISCYIEEQPYQIRPFPACRTCANCRAPLPRKPPCHLHALHSPLGPPRSQLHFFFGEPASPSAQARCYLIFTTPLAFAHDFRTHCLFAAVQKRSG